jgi:hypothetical protein
MEDEKIPIANPDYTAEEFDDEILLYTKNGSHAVYLNDTAYAVWQLCREKISVGEIIAYFEEAYPDQATQIRSDVIAALSMLESNNLISLR